VLHLTSRTPRRTRAGALLAVAVFALLGAFGATPALAAADDVDAPEIRWSVTPADESGPDGRTAVEHTLDPGETVDDHIAVRNASQEDITFSLTAADGFFTRNGRFDILATGEESVAAGTWIEIAESVSVPAGATVVVPFAIHVPEQVEPGDHAAGITASVLSIQSSEDGAAVGVESRVGVRVLSRVTGEITPSAKVESPTGQFAASWNPFRPGEITVTFDVVNDGNTRLLAQGAVDAGGQSTAFPAADENPQELLPGDTRPFTVIVDDVWPLFLVPTTVTLGAEALTIDGSTPAFVPVTAQVTVWAVPWPQLLLVLGIVLVVGAVVWGRIRSRRRVRSMIEEAREAGRREGPQARAQ
jgi:hypothetical protein